MHDAARCNVRFFPEALIIDPLSFLQHHWSIDGLRRDALWRCAEPFRGEILHAECICHAPHLLYSIFDRSPTAIVTWKTAGVKTVADLAGKTLAATPGDGAYQLFPAFCRANNFDVSRVKIIETSLEEREEVMHQRKVDGASALIPRFSTSWHAAPHAVPSHVFWQVSLPGNRCATTVTAHHISRRRMERTSPACSRFLWSSSALSLAPCQIFCTTLPLPVFSKTGQERVLLRLAWLTHESLPRTRWCIESPAVAGQDTEYP